MRNDCGAMLTWIWLQESTQTLEDNTCQMHPQFYVSKANCGGPTAIQTRQ